MLGLVNREIMMKAIANKCKDIYVCEKSCPFYSTFERQDEYWKHEYIVEWCKLYDEKIEHKQCIPECKQEFIKDRQAISQIETEDFLQFELENDVATEAEIKIKTIQKTYSNESITKTVDAIYRTINESIQYKDSDVMRIKMSILHTISHFSLGTFYPINENLVKYALETEYEDEIIDYAIKCAENWEDNALVESLKNLEKRKSNGEIHLSLGTLKYCRSIIGDLSK